MAKYGRKASEKVEEKMHELKEGKLRSGSGRKVKSRQQAVAIGLSEARREGGKVPSRRTSKKRSTAKSARSASAGTRGKSRTGSARKSTRKTTTRKGAKKR